MVTIYVLKLQENKYYVGKTTNPTYRLDDHFSEGGSAWTKKYKPISIHELQPDKPDTDIDLVCKLSDWDKFTAIASAHLVLKGDVNHGFAEYCDMLYYPYFTPGKIKI